MAAVSNLLALVQLHEQILKGASQRERILTDIRARRPASSAWCSTGNNLTGASLDIPVKLQFETLQAAGTRSRPTSFRRSGRGTYTLTLGP
jgi:hypothetical protein